VTETDALATRRASESTATPRINAEGECNDQATLTSRCDARDGRDSSEEMQLQRCGFPPDLGPVLLLGQFRSELTTSKGILSLAFNRNHQVCLQSVGLLR